MQIPDYVLELMKRAIQALGIALSDMFPRPAYDQDPASLPMNQDVPTPPTMPPHATLPPETTYLWDSPANARHSIRVICDELGLTVFEKNLITACIQQESGFKNTAIGQNRDKAGKLLSTDWGICQINDYWNVGIGKRWSSVEQIVKNPDKAVKWMIEMYRQGHLNLWVSYSSKAYLKYMP